MSNLFTVNVKLFVTGYALVTASQNNSGQKRVAFYRHVDKKIPTFERYIKSRYLCNIFR